MSRQGWRCVLIAAAVLIATCGTAIAQKLGIVLLHGKEAPGDSMQPLARQLSAAGYAVEVPEMCWSKRRIYDLPYLECMRDVDAAVERLKKRGASEIVILGQSLGGNFAIGYGAHRQGLKGIIVTAGGHHPAGIISTFPEISAAWQRARQLVTDGKGDAPRLKFPDNNDTGLFFVNATPKAYLSWYDIDGPANMQNSVRKLTAPLLWVSGDADPLQKLVGSVFIRAAKHPLNRHMTIKATHRGTPVASRDTVLAWLKELTNQK